MSICPNGHDSDADDYCDVCGLPIPEQGKNALTAAAPTMPGPAASNPGAEPAAKERETTCPHCSAVNPVNALFCEACGYDFTTGSMPRPVDPPAEPVEPADRAGSEDPAASADLAAPVAEPTAGPVAAEDGADDPWGTGTADRPATPAAAAANPSGPIAAGTVDADPVAWVAEVWIDPDWYADQKSTDALPSPGMPQIVALRGSSFLIGRASRSRGVAPQLDLSGDNGISRRHAQLTTDGTRWWVEDLGSSNGTYVGGNQGGLPEQAISVGRKVQVDDDDRIYLGAWTRIVIRRAEAGEFVAP